MDKIQSSWPQTTTTMGLLPSAYPTPLSTSLSLYGFPLRFAPSIRLRCHSLEQPDTPVNKRLVSGLQPTGSIKNSIQRDTHQSNLSWLGRISIISILQPQTVFAASKTSSSSVKLIQKSTTASSRPRRLIIAGFFAALTAAAVGASSGAQTNLEDAETLSNIPQTLSATNCDSPSQKNCKKLRIQRPKSKKAESCTIKCVTTCIRGGGGSPGEGPFNIIRPLVVFKQGFRSRQYCLVECSDICNLLPNDDP